MARSWTYYLILVLVIFSNACSSLPKSGQDSNFSHRFTSQEDEPNLKSLWHKKALYSFPERKYTWRVLLGFRSLPSYASPSTSKTQKSSCVLSTDDEYIVSDIAPQHSRLRLQDAREQNCGWFNAQDLILDRHPMIKNKRFLHFFPKYNISYTLRSSDKISRLDFDGFVIAKRNSLKGRQYLVSPSPDLSENMAKEKLGWVSAKGVFLNDYAVVTSSENDDKEVKVSNERKNSYFRRFPLVARTKKPVIILRRVLSSGYEVLINRGSFFSRGFISKRTIIREQLTFLPPLMKETKAFIELIQHLLTEHNYVAFGQQLVQACSHRNIELQELSSLCHHQGIHDFIIQQRDSEIEDFFADSSTDKSDQLGMNDEIKQRILLYKDRIDLISKVIQAINYPQYRHKSKYYE